MANNILSSLTQIGELIPSKKKGKNSQYTILALDDNLLNLKVVGLQLHELGLNYILVNNGTAALQEHLTRKYDLMILDLGMAPPDGYDVARTIREREKATGQHTRLIAYTADQTSEQRAIEVGFDEFIVKTLTELSDFLKAQLKFI